MDNNKTTAVSRSNLVTIDCVSCNHKLQACLLNTGSVKNEAPKVFFYHIMENACDILCITETKLFPDTVEQDVIRDMAHLEIQCSMSH